MSSSVNDMFKYAMIDLNENIYSISDIKKDLEKQNNKLELLQTSLTTEITESNASIDDIKKDIGALTKKITEIEDKIEQFCKVLVNHASIIKNIRTAITQNE